METNKQDLLNYILGGGVQQEKPASRVIRQGQTKYAQGNARTIPVPTHEEIAAQQRKKAEKAAASAIPQVFAPINWSQLGSTQQPKPSIKIVANSKEVKSPLWERVHKK